MIEGEEIAGVQLPDHDASSLGGPEAPIWKHSQPEGRPQKWAKDKDKDTAKKCKSKGRPQKWAKDKDTARDKDKYMDTALDNNTD